ncbi:hypothetical protein [Pelagibius marinus]|uniref:hypothetical protein n=1 Tax=Pelagibius marinus TaxID=2762760 RepID=UPI0018723CB9|nr:hypothetical protein [Pelagibius marinus]
MTTHMEMLGERLSGVERPEGFLARGLKMSASRTFQTFETQAPIGRCLKLTQGVSTTDAALRQQCGKSGFRANQHYP